MNMIKSPSVETLAVDAVRLGRRLAADWPDAAVENTASAEGLIAAALVRLGAGEVFAKTDDHVLTLMLAAIRQTLDSFQPGYGAYFLREHTAEDPFYDADQEKVRRLGELLKSFVEARQTVLDTIIAEREIIMLRRR